ncbi:MAG: hypothetical protein MUF21_06985 [Gemmatimonadaceae bacterium]|jgi:3-oxoacyl-[acyl-carrier-protein] synthase-1|nr:hypothetical protein [Gemmatimonadaceae bacterium]
MVVAVGAVTAVGLSAPETAASLRAGVRRLRESRLVDLYFAPITLAELPDEGLADLVDGVDSATEDGVVPGGRERRLLRLAAMPLAEVLRVMPRDVVPPPIAIALPGRPPAPDAAQPIDGRWFPARLAMQLAALGGGTFDVTASRAVGHGRAGGLVALERAAAAVRSGAAPFAIAGGVDTFRDARLLHAYDRIGRLKTERRGDGFLPGEGAAFVLLAAVAAAERATLAPLAWIAPVVTGTEDGHFWSDTPYRGEGLAAAVAGALDAAAITPAAPVEEVYVSMNGEHYWAKEWSVAQLRQSDRFAPDHAMHHPAEGIGDTGAAWAPLAVGLAALGMRDGYRASPSLVYASSDDGLRAAVVVRGA